MKTLAVLLLALCAACGEPRDALAPDAARDALPASPPRAVVPAAAGLLDLVAELIPADRVAGLPEQALVYSRPLAATHPLLARPRFERYDAESILALRPDFVVAQPWQSGETTSRLREAGVPVTILPAANDWPALRANIRLLGERLHAPDAAAALLAACDARVAALALPPDTPRPGALVYSNYGGQGRVAAADTLSHAILQLAGLRNLAAEAGLEGHQLFGFEELLTLDPELLVVGKGSADMGSTWDLLHDDPRLAQLRAVREGRVFALEPWLHVTTSHHLITAAEVLREQLEQRGVLP